MAKGESASEREALGGAPAESRLAPRIARLRSAASVAPRPTASAAQAMGRAIERVVAVGAGRVGRSAAAAAGAARAAVRRRQRWHRTPRCWRATAAPRLRRRARATTPSFGVRARTLLRRACPSFPKRRARRPHREICPLCPKRRAPYRRRRRRRAAVPRAAPSRTSTRSSTARSCERALLGIPNYS